MKDRVQLVHLSREIKTALELALAALSPTPMIEELALAAGLLDAFSELAVDERTPHPLLQQTVERAELALRTWHRWRADHPPKATA
jgi:hypothetical protein